MPRHVVDQLRAAWPKLGAFIDASEADVLAHMDFPVRHRSKVHGTNPLERLKKEVKRRADVVGIFPNEGAVIRLIRAVLPEANDEWQLQHHYMRTEAMAELTPPTLDALPPQISTAAGGRAPADPSGSRRGHGTLRVVRCHAEREASDKRPVSIRRETCERANTRTRRA